LRSREPLEMRFEDPPTGEHADRSRSAKPKKSEERDAETTVLAKASSIQSPPPKSATPKATPRKTTVASAKSKPPKTLAKTVNEKDIAKAVSAEKRKNKRETRKSEPAGERAKSFGMRKPTGLSPPAESEAADHHPVGSKRSLSVTPFETAPISKRQKRKSAVPQKKASTVRAASIEFTCDYSGACPLELVIFRVMKKPESGMLTRPLPMAAMALTAVGGVLTAWFYLGIKGLSKL
ncbi:hypothetical protein FOZ61_001731, partial [Perkinsus olseni]